MRFTPYIEPERRRSLSSLRLWMAVAFALGLALWTGTQSLFWSCSHPWFLPASLLLGHILFGISRSIVRLSPREGWHGMLASMRFLYHPYGGETLLFYFFLALAEELVFRAIPLVFLSGTWWHVLALAVIFTGIHVLPRWRRLSPLTVLDFLLFGLALGFLFLWLQDLWPLVLIHWVRNSSVAKVHVRRDQLEALMKNSKDS